MMNLNFPNPSRSYDESNRRIRFWGYDQSLEIAFFVEIEVLKRLCPNMELDEEGFLKAFDLVRSQIYQTADRVYRQSKGKLYMIVLTVKDFS